MLQPFFLTNGNDRFIIFFSFSSRHSVRVRSFSCVVTFVSFDTYSVVGFSNVAISHLVLKNRSFGTC
jgi:hypothetical protein